MNICLVYKHYPLSKDYDSGIGTYFTSLAEQLEKNNKVVILTTSKKATVTKSGNLTIITIPYLDNIPRSISFLAHLINVNLTLSRIIRQHNIQIVHFVNWESEGLLFLLTSNIFLKTVAVTTIVTPSAIDNKYFGQKKYFSVKLKEFCEKLFVNLSSNNLISPSHSNIEICKKIYNTTKPIEVIPLGVNLRYQFRYRYKRQTKESVVLYWGRLEKRKGTDILIKSIPSVLAKKPDTRFYIAGRENNNHDWVNYLRNSIPLEYINRVSFLGYIDSQQRLNEFIKTSDICVMPSRYESFGLVIIEAMKYGKPVIATNVGGIPEIIKNGKNGILVNPNRKEFAKALIGLLSSKSLRKLIGSNARRDWRTNFTAKTMSDNTFIYYQKLLG